MRFGRVRDLEPCCATTLAPLQRQISIVFVLMFIPLNSPVPAMIASWRVQTPATFPTSSFQPEIAEEWVVSTQESVVAVVCEVPIAYCTQSTTNTCVQQQKPPSTDFLVFDASEKVIICTVALVQSHSSILMVTCCAGHTSSTTKFGARLLRASSVCQSRKFSRI